MSASTQQYRRECEVFVGVPGRGVGIRDLRITFEITKSIALTPNTALIRIFNLSQDNESKIREEFDGVVVNAGYHGSSLLIFRGSIRHTSPYREGNDRIMEIDAADGDDDLKNTIVNSTLAAGTTLSQAVDHLVALLKKTTRGHMVLKDGKRLRGKVMSGMASKYVNEIAMQVDAACSVQDGQIVFIPELSTLPTEAIVLRSDTGMLGAPEVSDKGVKVRCLLNPRIKIGGKIQIDNNDLKLKIKKEREKKPGGSNGAHGPGRAAPKKKVGLSRLDPDGIYKVIHLVHKGDTRGTGSDWTTEVIAMPLPGKTIPAGKAAA